jgi:hypothetical protein
VIKPDGSYRVAFDVRELSEMLQYVGIVGPTRDELLAMFAGCNWFMTIDLLMSFWQLLLSRDASGLHILSTPDSTWRSLRVIMGSNNSTAALPCAVRHVLGDLLHHRHGVRRTETQVHHGALAGHVGASTFSLTASVVLLPPNNFSGSSHLIFATLLPPATGCHPSAHLSIHLSTWSCSRVLHPQQRRPYILKFQDEMDRMREEERSLSSIEVEKGVFLSCRPVGQDSSGPYKTDTSDCGSLERRGREVELLSNDNGPEITTVDRESEVTRCVIGV